MSNNYPLMNALRLVSTSGDLTTLDEVGFTNTLAGVNVTWSQINTLEFVTSAVRLPTTPNEFLINDTFVANDNYLAPTIVSTLSAVPLGDAKLMLKKDTGGAVFEEVDLTQNGVSYTTPAGATTTNTWANIIAGNANPTLSQVLTAGNTATNSIAVNNSGTGTNVISLLPNASASNPTITLTDGTTTNTIDKNGYTTRNTSANATHYLNFSDNSSTGTGDIQKTAGLSVNPSTNTITATTLTTTNLSVVSPYNFSVVSIYANATARDTALPTPYAGQMAFLTGSNKLQYWNTNWYNVTPAPATPIITGFTITTQYEIIYVNASNVVITAPTLDGYTIVRFFPTTTTSGTITLPNTTSVEYLIVGGGGGGGGGAFLTFNGGGGGAGGLLTGTNSMVASTSYAVSVGQGGTAGAIAGSGGSGANSSLVVVSGTITATGGGGGGAGVVGVSGGSGGGGSWTGTAVGLAGGAGTALQGNTGGSSTPSSATYPYSGGGGGSSAVGSSTNGQGGVGTSSTITGGSALFYSGGGGGGAGSGIAIGTNPIPIGGSGVGGNGGYPVPSNVPPTAGTNGRGGGGGGRGNWTSSAGAAGGSGVVIVRFASYS